MRRALAHPISVPLLILVLSAQPTPHDVGALVARDLFYFVGGTEVERETFEKAHRRYVDAGLILPRMLRIEFTDDIPACRGYDGLYIHTSQTIRFCRASAEDWYALPKLILHELGHAWDNQNLTEENRRFFMEKYGKTTRWLDRDLPHDQRPGEKLANAVAGVVQGLISPERLQLITGRARPPLGSDGVQRDAGPR